MGVRIRGEAGQGGADVLVEGGGRSAGLESSVLVLVRFECFSRMLRCSYCCN